MSERQEKQARFAPPTEGRRHRRLLFVAALVLVAIGLLGWGFGRSRGVDGALLRSEGGMVSLPLAEVGDGQAHFYRYQSGEKTVSFFVVRGGDGRLRAALDTCDVCYEAKKGYRQEGSDMVCNNCDQRFPTIRINEVAGGCNPVGLPVTVDGERLILTATDLDRGARYF